jgi:hypothetical protein
MSIYAAQGTSAVAARTALNLVSAASIRPRLLDYVLSTTGAPNSDASYEIQLKRFTAAGTSTAVVLAATDSSDPLPPILAAGSNNTVEPTYTGTPIDDRGVNPRSTWRWQAYDQRAEIIMPATAASGLGFLVALLGGASTIIVDAKVLQ